MKTSEEKTPWKSVIKLLQIHNLHEMSILQDMKYQLHVCSIFVYINHLMELTCVIRKTVDYKQREIFSMFYMKLPFINLEYEPFLKQTIQVRQNENKRCITSNIKPVLNLFTPFLFLSRNSFISVILYIQFIK